MHDSAPSRKAALQHSGAALPFAALLLGNVALAFGPWFVRAADVGPVAAGFWRLALGVPFLFAIVMATEGNPLRHAKGLGITLFFAGIAFAADLASWHVGILHTTLANATLFGNSATLMFPIWGFLIARAWPTRQQGIALALAAAGAVLLLGRSYSLSPQNMIGDLLCLLAGALYTVYFILMTRARGAMTPLSALALSSAVGTLPLLLFAIAMGEQIWPHNWGVLVGLALASQVFGQGLLIYALGHLSPLVVGIGLLSQPIIAGTIGWIVYGERLGVPDFIGAVLVAIALVLVRRGSTSPGQVATIADEAKP
ncbi:EamA family transporter [Sphingomonas koreensis]|uniref:EamA family transporter n=1 Tax=Sphingomonas koreensis TaxID=93064 RepID=A0A2M8WDM4_9SPHN|nr:DMT family transporter [Sphingomonas koreensis]PJI89026.1 threonine/homoserine efflux transporter RhtA [Sphingomonas koreensis]RSU63389.1 EamA family transporter [Sphingomonas koreensis]RSU71055.1 EamA family transporter [Sphingomonas koreensis]RSY88079.1 EamA family transporter [Sphingomonas koreensis]